MAIKPDYTLLKPLLDLAPKLDVGYALAFDKGLYKVHVDVSRSGYNSVRELPKDQLPIPQQLLITMLTYQPFEDTLYTIQKEYQDRCLFYLYHIIPEQMPDYKLQPGKFSLRYNVEITMNNCKVILDLKASGFAALRDVPKDDLPTTERMFISFLSGIPLNNGAFFVNQRLMAKLFFFLSKIEHVYHAGAGHKVRVRAENLPYNLLIKAVGTGYAITLATDEHVNPKDLMILGEKEYVVTTKDNFWPIRLPDYYALSPFSQTDSLVLPSGLAPDFLSHYIPFMNEHGINYTLDNTVAALEKRIITKAPTPVLEITQTGAKHIQAKLLYDYGIGKKIEYTHGVLGDFYQITVEGKDYFCKRDKKSESWLHNYLLDMNFLPGKNGYEVSEDNFIDFFSYQYDGLKQTIGLLITGENLQKYRFDHDTEFAVDLEFRESSGIDWFDFSPAYKIKDDTFTHEQIKDLIDENKDFIRLKDGSLVKVPTKEFEYLQTYLADRKIDKKTGKYKLKKFDMYFLYSAVRDKYAAHVDETLQQLVARIENFEGIPDFPVPVTIQGVPRHYQQTGFNWLGFLNQYGFSGILADDMGLGKTLQVLMLFTYLKENKQLRNPSLIVVPTTVVFNWMNEINKFAPTLKVMVLTGSKDRAAKIKTIKEYDLVITSYALIRNDLPHYAETQFEYIILDEAQYIKNHKTQVTQAVKCLQSNFRLALTGTPIENRYSELWSIFDFLMPGFLSTYGYFKSFYESEQDRLQRKIKPFLLRRTKKGVLPELPPKNEIDSFCEMLPEQEQQYMTILQSQRKEVYALLKEKSVEQIQINILASLLKLRQICCHPALLKDQKTIVESAKFNQYKELLEEILDAKAKVVVFSQFVQMLTIMRKQLEAEGISYVYLDGSTKNRQEVIEKFNGDTSVQVFLCSLKAGGFGINLTAANYVILYDPWWNPAVEQQAMDRVYRLGQTKEVFVYKMITKNSVEEKILKLQAKKKSMIEQVIHGGGSGEYHLTKSDLEDLFA